jgi:hypothetical protein
MKRISMSVGSGMRTAEVSASADKRWTDDRRDTAMNFRVMDHATCIESEEGTC